MAAIALASLTLGGAVACSSDGDTTAAADTSAAATDTTMAMTDDSMASGVNAAVTPAADLRAGLTALLQEHMYLAAFAVDAAVNNPPAFDAAAAALDTNSVDLADAVGSIYGEEAGAAFLDLWRIHIGFFVDYTGAAAAGDEAGKTQAEEALSAYFLDLGDFLEKANPELPSEAVAEQLAPHASSLFAVIDSVVAGSPDAYAQLREASGHMSMIAEVLASGIVAQDPAAFES